MMAPTQSQSQSQDLLYQNLISYQKIEDFESMIRLVETQTETDQQNQETCKTSLLLSSSSPVILYFYAFALSRRNLEGDREKSLEVIKQALSLALKLEQEQEQKSTNGTKIKENSRLLELFCLCGRIYKNKFVESDFEDRQSLTLAIDWYRKAFGVRLNGNEFAGINLATLLVASGLEFENSIELQNIGKVINNLLEEKESKSLPLGYWDLATTLEFNILTQNYEKAIEAAVKIFSLRPQPPPWNVKSTMGNIQLVLKMRTKQKEKEKNMDTKLKPQENTLNFWIQFLQAQTTVEMEQNEELEQIPVLIEHENETENGTAEGFAQKYLSVVKEIEQKDEKQIVKSSLRLSQVQDQSEERDETSQQTCLLIDDKFISISESGEGEESEEKSRQLRVKLEDSTQLTIHLPNSHFCQRIIHILNLQ